MASRTTLIALSCAWLVAAGSAAAGPTLLFDAGGRILYSEDADDQWHPASLTKIMTAYLTFEALKSGQITKDTMTTTSETAHAQPPSKVGLPVGGQLTVELALKALIVKSANDVAVMLAETVAGSEEAFVERMNATARRLGMTRTRFVNSNGLPAPEQITTARDLARLSLAVLGDFPEYRELWAMADMRIGTRRLLTHNSLLKTYEGADGLKTGFICDSGFNVVASATRAGRQLMAVVLGESSGAERSIRAASLLDHGFQTYDWKMLLGTTTLDSMPLTTEPRAVASVRNSVTSWSCGGQQRRMVRKRDPAPSGDKLAVRKPADSERADDSKEATATAGAGAAAAKAKPKAAVAPQPSTAKTQ